MQRRRGAKDVSDTHSLSAFFAPLREPDVLSWFETDRLPINVVI